MSYLQAVGMGAVAGMRSMAAPALVSDRLSKDEEAAGTGLVGFMAQPRVALGFKLLAAAEAIADKTPWVPDRTSPPALVGRAVAGALVGAVLCARDGERPEVGAALGV